MSKLVTRRSASRGDLLKNLGVRFGGRVSGLRLPVPAASQARSDPCGWSRSRFSVEAGLGWRCFGYQPRAGPPASRSISPLASAWLMLRCRLPIVVEALMPTTEDPRLLVVELVLGAVRLPLPCGGTSGARLCGVRGMSQPLAKMGVSGRLQDVCSDLSSRGLCAVRFW